MSEIPLPTEKKEEEGTYFKIFDYIVEMEDRVDKIITYTQDKSQQQYLEKEKQLAGEFEQKINALTTRLEERKRVVEEKIARDKNLYNQLITDKIQKIQTKFSQHKDAICERILLQFNLPFSKSSSQNKSPHEKTTKRTKK